jgi:hypothetical protein
MIGASRVLTTWSKVHLSPKQALSIKPRCKGDLEDGWNPRFVRSTNLRVGIGARREGEERLTLPHFTWSCPGGSEEYKAPRMSSKWQLDPHSSLRTHDAWQWVPTTTTGAGSTPVRVLRRSTHAVPYTTPPDDAGALKPEEDDVPDQWWECVKRRGRRRENGSHQHAPTTKSFDGPQVFSQWSCSNAVAQPTIMSSHCLLEYCCSYHQKSWEFWVSKTRSSLSVSACPCRMVHTPALNRICRISHTS